MENSLNGQKIVVVGGSSGMGMALCGTLMRQGCEVLIVGRSQEKLEAANDQLSQFGKLRTHQADVTQEEEVRQLFDATGAIDHLVCTAADIRGAYELLPQLELVALDRVIRSKVVAPILLAKHGAPKISVQGSITLISGIAAYRPRPKGVAVAAINAALEGVVRAMDLAVNKMVILRWFRTWMNCVTPCRADGMWLNAERPHFFIRYTFSYFITTPFEIGPHLQSRDSFGPFNIGDHGFKGAQWHTSPV